MKTVLYLAILLFTVQLSSQYISRFDKGYDDGFKKGYCQDQGFTCFSPVPPISPMPNAQERNNSYADGFARGVADGMTKQQSNSDGSMDRKPMKRRTEFTNPYNADLFGEVVGEMQSNYNNTQAWANQITNRFAQLLQYFNENKDDYSSNQLTKMKQHGEEVQRLIDIFNKDRSNASASTIGRYNPYFSTLESSMLKLLKNKEGRKINKSNSSSVHNNSLKNISNNDNTDFRTRTNEAINRIDSEIDKDDFLAKSRLNGTFRAEKYSILAYNNKTFQYQLQEVFQEQAYVVLTNEPALYFKKGTEVKYIGSKLKFHKLDKKNKQLVYHDNYNQIIKISTSLDYIIWENKDISKPSYRYYNLKKIAN